MDWSYFNKFEWAEDKYLPDRGEGDTMATQLLVATSKLVYKWYNDGDVFDNTYGMEGWWNDLSSYANWIYTYIPGASCILDRIKECQTRDEYEQMLADLCDATHQELFLAFLDKQEKVGSVYDCSGPYKYVDGTENEEDELEDEEEDEYDEWEDDDE